MVTCAHTDYMLKFKMIMKQDMSMSENIAALASLSQRSVVLLPEISATLTPLAKDLASIQQMGLPHDRRLLTIDLDNLVEGVERIIKIRDAGLDPEELEVAIVDMSALASDMRVRCVKAIRNEAAEIAIHASVAAMRVEKDEGPIDLTREFRMITALPPAQDDNNPGVIISNPLESETYGRVTGQSMAFILEKDHKVATYGAVILPPNAAARFKKGDQVILHVEGVESGDRFAVPTRGDEISEILFEAADDDMVIHGPAVMSHSTFKNLSLKDVVEFSVESEKLASLTPLSHWQNYIYTMILYVISSTIFARLFLNELDDLGGWGVLLAGAAGAAFCTLPTLLLTILFALLKDHLLGKKVSRSIFLLPSFERAASFCAKAIKGYNGPTTAVENEKHQRKFMKNIKSRQFLGQQFNFFPARKLHVLAHEGVKIMRPLPALPSPDAFNVVPLFDAKKKVPA